MVKEITLTLDGLRPLAFFRRPELAAHAARIHEERNAVAFASREFYPDVEYVRGYVAFWQDPEEDLRPVVGMNINVPIYKQNRWAAVRETLARVAQHAELDSRLSEVVLASRRINKSKRVEQRSPFMGTGRSPPPGTALKQPEQTTSAASLISCG